MNISELTGVIIAIAVIVGGVGYWFGGFKKGKFNRRKDDLELESQTLRLLNDRLISVESLSAKQTLEIDALKAGIARLETQNAELKDILQNRNPDFLAFMTFLTEFAKESRIYMQNDERKTDAIKDGVAKLVGAMQSSSVKL